MRLASLSFALALPVRIANRQAIAAYPDDSAAWFSLGSVLESENDLSAADAYQQSVSTDPRFIKTLVALSDLSLRDSHWPRALHHAERALDAAQLDKAESSARKCVDLDHAHTAPGAMAARDRLAAIGPR